MPHMTDARPRAAVVERNGERARAKILYLSLVHPDFLPSIYSVAHVIAEAGHAVRILSFDSPAPGRFNTRAGIEMTGCGSHDGTLRHRARARSRFRRVLRSLLDSEPPSVVVTACPFSYLQALRFVPQSIPIIYQAFETYPASVRDFRHSPFTTWRNWRALRQLGRAALVCTPSPERSGWLMAYAGLSSLPATILNVPSWRETLLDDRPDHGEAVPLPAAVADKHVVINTGRVNATQATLELVESVAAWPDDACLVVTNVGDTAYDRSIRAARDRSARRSDIVLLPMVSRAAMRWLQKRAAIGVCLMRTTSSLEAIMPAPNKVGEYLHAGLLIVGNRTAYLDRLRAHGVVEIAEGLEGEAIAAAVIAAVRSVRGGNARARVRTIARSWYCMEVQALPILAVLDKVARPVTRQSSVVTNTSPACVES